MNIWSLVFSYLKSRPLNTVLNVFLLALGVAMIVLLIQVTHQFQQKVAANSKGVDLVVGAKGSPMQLILCNIFHIDFPTGNINLAEAERVAGNRLVKRAIPMALGDSYQGFRIVGTTHAYPEMYLAQVQRGKLWSKPMEVTLGYNVARNLGLTVGAAFLSNHGLTASGHAHESESFVVSGIFDPGQSVLDNLILTSIESVWQVHDVQEGQSGVLSSEQIASPLVPSIAAGDSAKAITSLLIQYRSAMGAVQMPRWVNGQSSLQAASPAFETARLFSIVGVGVDILRSFAFVLIFISALSIFIALYNSLKERRYDLAIMRSMGASRSRVFLSVLLEGLVLTLAGALSGIALAHLVLIIFQSVSPQAETAGISGLVFLAAEAVILAGSLLLGFLCALFPAMQAYRTDISKVLASA